MAFYELFRNGYEGVRTMQTDDIVVLKNLVSEIKESEASGLEREIEELEALIQKKESSL